MQIRGLLVFIAKRLLIAALLLLLVSFLVFSLVFLAPGSAVDAYLGLQPRTPEIVAELTARYNLDEPFLVQYWMWLQGAVQLDFGISSRTQGPVTDAIAARAGVSGFLAIYAYLVALVLGIIPGVIAGLRRGKALDRGLVAGAIVAFSTPSFVLGILLLFVFAVLIPVFPAAGIGQGFGDMLWHLTLPAIALALSIAAFLMRHTRVSVIAALSQDYVQFARARGLSWNYILMRYTFRNALIPVVTVSGAVLAFFFTGAVLVESTFSINGLGTLLVASAESRDIAMVQGLSMLIAAIILSANLFADLAYGFIDPRIRLVRSSK